MKYFTLLLIGIMVAFTVTVLFLFSPAAVTHLYNDAWKSSGNEFPDCFESYLTISNCDWSEEYFEGLALWSNVASVITLLVSAVLIATLSRKIMVVRNS